MSTLIVEANYDSYYYQHNAVYLTAHDATAASNMGSVPAVGQESTTVGGTDYFIYRGGLEFDTSSILAGDTINAATLSLYGLTDSSVNDFNLTIVSGTDLANPREAADYGDLLNDTTSGGEISTSGWSLSSYNVITLNDTGLAMITKAGTTKLAFRSSKDINSTPPTLGDAYDEWVEFYGVDVTYPAKLNITYNKTFIPKVVTM